MINNLLNIYKKKNRLIIGLMSGTSLDGIDTVILKVTGSGTNTRISQVDFVTYPFPNELKDMILRNAETNGGNVTEICKLNFYIAHYYATSVKKICKKNKIELSEIDLIGSHGQTIHHLPVPSKEFGLNAASTLQIGDPSVLAKLTGILTIGDFRVGDVALGGQGAPLVPYFDYIMFNSKTKNRCLLNIGGIANLTVLKKNCTSEDVYAFDTGPGNMLIDTLMKKYYNKPYDKDGKIARQGRISEILFSALKEKDYYIYQKPPKSTGREYYGKYFLPEILNSFPDIDPSSIISTITEYTSYSINFNYEMYLKKKVRIEELFVSGGGAYNPAVMDGLSKYFGKSVQIKKIESLGFSSDSKEAVCFAILANELINGNATNVPKVTGANRQTLLGKICLP